MLSDYPPAPKSSDTVHQRMHGYRCACLLLRDQLRQSLSIQTKGMTITFACCIAMISHSCPSESGSSPLVSVWRIFGKYQIGTNVGRIVSGDVSKHLETSRNIISSANVSIVIHMAKIRFCHQLVQEQHMIKISYAHQYTPIPPQQHTPATYKHIHLPRSITAEQNDNSSNHLSSFTFKQISPKQEKSYSDSLLSCHVRRS